MRTIVLAMAVALAGQAWAQDKPATAKEPAKAEKVEKAEKEEKAEKPKRASTAKRQQDARQCLDQPSNTAIIKCAEGFL